MANNESKVVVIGGGAAGIAAARQLQKAGVDALLLEARSRLGGRAWTSSAGSGFPLDLGCGWLHSADRNPWRVIAEAQGYSIDKTPPPWTRPSMPFGFQLDDQEDFGQSLLKFYERLGSFREEEPDKPAAAFLELEGRWNNLINAVSTYVSGVELDRVSARDLARYDDTDVNWRVIEGYGRAIAGYASNLPVKLNCPVQQIDRSGKRLKIETADGAIWADAAIITLPSNLLTDDKFRFIPPLLEKNEAAAGLPLGLADKLFLSLTDAEEFEADSRLVGRTDQRGTGAYHFRPFGRPLIEAYFGGSLAHELEQHGERAFYDFSASELVALLGGDFARRIKPLQAHCWGTDHYARGSYSYALPGKANCRRVLAEPVDSRLFFAGEACSLSVYSTAHGAYITGIEAANHALDALNARRDGRQHLEVDRTST
jgi:monoamine oxidase